MSVKTYGPLTIYRQGSEERHYFGTPDAHRDALAASWGWSILRTEAVAKSDYDAIAAENATLRSRVAELEQSGLERWRLYRQGFFDPEALDASVDSALSAQGGE